MAFLPTQGTGIGVRTEDAVLLAEPMTVLATSTWTLSDATRKADITTAFTGAAAYGKVIGDPTVVITCPADFSLDPEIAGMEAGETIPYLWLFTVAPTWNVTSGVMELPGEATLIRNTYVESVEHTTDSTADVQRLRITCTGGKRYLYQEPPTPNIAPGSILP